MSPGQQKYYDKIKKQREADRLLKRNLERFKRTEGNTRYIYGTEHVLPYTAFNARKRDAAEDGSFTAYYKSLSVEERKDIVLQNLS